VELTKRLGRVSERSCQGKLFIANVTFGGYTSVWLTDVSHILTIVLLIFAEHFCRIYNDICNVMIALTVLYA